MSSQKTEAADVPMDPAPDQPPTPYNGGALVPLSPDPAGFDADGGAGPGDAPPAREPVLWVASPPTPAAWVVQDYNVANATIVVQGDMRMCLACSRPLTNPHGSVHYGRRVQRRLDAGFQVNLCELCQAADVVFATSQIVLSVRFFHGDFHTGSSWSNELLRCVLNARQTAPQSKGYAPVPAWHVRLLVDVKSVTLSCAGCLKTLRDPRKCARRFEWSDRVLADMHATDADHFDEPENCPRCRDINGRRGSAMYAAAYHTRSRIVGDLAPKQCASCFTPATPNFCSVCLGPTAASRDEKTRPAEAIVSAFGRFSRGASTPCEECLQTLRSPTSVHVQRPMVTVHDRNGMHTGLGLFLVGMANHRDGPALHRLRKFQLNRLFEPRVIDIIAGFCMPKVARVVLNKGRNHAKAAAQAAFRAAAAEAETAAAASSSSSSSNA